MIQIQKQLELPHQIEIEGGELIGSVEGLVGAIIVAGDRHAQSKELPDEGEIYEFKIGCDALNVWRAEWRLREEFDEALVAVARPMIISSLCEKREYDVDEFELAMEATSNRPRCPFGIEPLRFALNRSRNKPFEILHKEINDPLSRTILSIAINLKLLNRDRPVLLPIDRLRKLLGCRKLVVGGAVKRLINNDLLLEVGEKAHTGKAREFLVRAKEGTDYRV